MKASDIKKWKRWELIQYILDIECDNLEDEEE
mgnify:CR=1 FL=1